MKSRHLAREIALQILYRYDIAGAHPTTSAALKTELEGHFGHFHVSENLQPFVALLVEGTLGSMSILDGLLEKHMANWRLSRLAHVDRSLLRMAVFEMTQVSDTPISVVIDEAVELAKQFGTADSPAFVNGVLDAIKGAREIQPAPASDH
ncbi:transcription antitermination factor NusB [Bdellovibrionota bacterium FG-2]